MSPGLVAVLVAVVSVGLLATQTLAQGKILSEKDIDRIAQQWDEEDEEDLKLKEKMMGGGGGGFQMPADGKFDPAQMMAQQNAGKPKMLFCHVFTKTKPEAEKLGV